MPAMQLSYGRIKHPQVERRKIMHYAITDTTAKVVVNVQYSKIGFPYTNIYAETMDPDTGEILAINIDTTTFNIRKMDHDDFLEWYRSGNPTNVHEIALDLGMNKDALRGIITELEKGGI